jgi:nucleoid-associated protein YgaU
VSVARLTATTATVAAIGAALGALAPHPVATAAALTAPQRLADTAGPDAVVLAVAGLLAWLVWAWAALGLLLTAASALPGALGALARLLLRIAVPAGLRRAASLALGVGIGLNAPFLAGTALAATTTPSTTSTTSGSTAPVPDWPAVPSTAAPRAPAPPATTPAPPATGGHVVVRGDCLWRIARDALEAAGDRPSDAVVASSVRAWWTANQAAIGPDPDLLRPGQVLQPPAPPGGHP